MFSDNTNSSLVHYDCQDGTKKSVTSDYHILLNTNIDKVGAGGIDPFNGDAGDGSGSSYHAGSSTKMMPNGQGMSTDTLENLHNAIFNMFGKMAYCNYPPVHPRLFNRDKPIFFLGNCLYFDESNTVNDVTYYYVNGLMIGAKGEDPMKIAILREAMTLDLFPLFKKSDAEVDPLPLVK